MGYPGILSTSNSTPSLAKTKSSLTKGTGIPFGNSWGFTAIFAFQMSIVHTRRNTHTLDFFIYLKSPFPQPSGILQNILFNSNYALQTIFFKKNKVGLLFATSVWIIVKLYFLIYHILLYRIILFSQLNNF